MSSAANHRKRSHRSQAKHYAAEARQYYRNISKQDAKDSNVPAMLKRLFNRMHGKSQEV